ncbi:MAG: hypothetical protein M0Q51_13260 [Bacteroidales bacterium]|nr:hypothetical protein [Bacteroidales bacterium]
MQSKISTIIHYNRDENSFTARFFERLIIRFENNKEDFNKFLYLIEEAATANNKEVLKNKTLQPPSFRNLQYEDSMPFLENVDLYSYCKRSGIDIKIDKETIDKTEFDFVMTAVDDKKKSTIIVFEVKCFTDLKWSEINRQNDILKKYQAAGLYDNFYHIALISYENLVRGKVPRQAFPGVKNFSIVTWEDVKSLIDFGRIRKEIEFSLMKKVIHLDGEGKTKRTLIKTL